MTSSNSKVNFLDMTISRTAGRIETTIYTKATDRHMYLHSRSDHPKTTKNAIPYGLAIRAKRICSTPEEYNNNRQRISDNLFKRGYQKRKTNNIMKKVDNLDRNNLLRYQRKSREKIAGFL